MRILLNRALVLLVCVLVVESSAGSAALRSVHAQEPIPDIRGTYPLYGTQSVTGCGSEGGDFTSSFVGSLVIAAQDGDQINGYFGFPEQATIIFSLNGTVTATGMIEGTWTFQQTPEDPFAEEAFVGHVVGADADIEFTANYGVQGVVCSYRVSLASISATLVWQAPDPSSTAAFPPPRALTLTESTPKQYESPGAGAVTGYKIYRSSSPNVATVPANLFAQVPPTQTNLPTGAAAGGTFFVVTSTYEGGESDPSNEVSGGLTPAVLTKVKVTSAKIKATGTGFSGTVLVLVDGIPFVSGAVVKNGKKVTQKGALLTGQTLGQYLTPGRVVAITFRNEDGAIATWVYTKP